MALCTHYCDYQLLIWMHHSAGFSCQLSRLLRRRTIKLVGPLHCRVRYKLYILTVAFYWRQLNLTFYQSSCSAITITHLQSCNLGTAHIILTMGRPVAVRYAACRSSNEQHRTAATSAFLPITLKRVRVVQRNSSTGHVLIFSGQFVVKYRPH